MDTLTIGCGEFGQFTATHLFNLCDECVAANDHEEADITDRSPIACAPFYRETASGSFEPRLILTGQQSDFIEPEEPHPYQVWASDKTASSTPPDFDFHNTVRTYRDFADFQNPYNVAEIRPRRPNHENEEVIFDAIRREAEIADSVAAVNVISQPPVSLDDSILDDGDKSLSFVLEEFPKSAVASVFGLPDCTWLRHLEEDLSQYILGTARMASVRRFCMLYDQLRGKAGKLLLPVQLEPRLLSTDSLDSSSLYGRSSVGAIMIDALTLPYRDRKVDSFSAYSRLVPSFSPLVEFTRSEEEDWSHCIGGMISTTPRHHHFWARVARVKSMYDDAFVFPDPLAVPHSFPGERRLLYDCIISSPLQRSRKPATGFLATDWVAENLRDSNVLPRGSVREEFEEIREQIWVMHEDLNFGPDDIEDVLLQ